MNETFDTLAARFSGEVDGRTIQPIRRQLVARRQELRQSTVATAARFEEVRSALMEGRRNIAAMRIGPHGHDVLVAGLGRTYGRGRKASRAVALDPNPGALHEWRKRVKYHGYHLRVLHGAWPAVLRALLLENPACFAHEDAVVTFLNLMQRRRAQLERQARRIGGLLFAEKPDHFARRFGVDLSAGLALA